MRQQFSNLATAPYDHLPDTDTIKEPQPHPAPDQSFFLSMMKSFGAANDVSTGYNQEQSVTVPFHRIARQQHRGLQLDRNM